VPDEVVLVEVVLVPEDVVLVGVVLGGAAVELLPALVELPDDGLVPPLLAWLAFDTLLEGCNDETSGDEPPPPPPQPASKKAATTGSAAVRKVLCRRIIAGAPGIPRPIGAAGGISAFRLARLADSSTDQRSHGTDAVPATPLSWAFQPLDRRLCVPAFRRVCQSGHQVN